jgi:hypothetical protein
MKEKFFIYNVEESNCQHFILGLLKGSNSLTPQAEEFVKQKTEKIFENMPQTKSITNRITDLAGKVDIIVNGGDVYEHIKTYPQYCSYYYNTIAKTKGIKYKDMIKSSEFKESYNKFKNNKVNL